MRSFYLFALPLIGVFLVITGLATGLEEIEFPPSRNHAVKSETAKNVPRIDDYPEDRTTNTEGPVVDLAYKIESFMSKVGDILIAFCKPRMAQRLNQQNNRDLPSRAPVPTPARPEHDLPYRASVPTPARPEHDLPYRASVPTPAIPERDLPYRAPVPTSSILEQDPPSYGLARIIDDFKTVSPSMRPGVITSDMRRHDNELALEQLVKVKRMAKEYYEVAPTTSTSLTSVSEKEPLEALLKSPGITTELSRLRDMNARADATTFHIIREEKGSDVDAAKYFRVLKHNPLEYELGAQCEQLLFNWWIMNEKKPKDVLTVFLVKAESLDDLYLAMDIVAHYMVHIYRMKEGLYKVFSRSQAEKIL